LDLACFYIESAFDNRTHSVQCTHTWVGYIEMPIWLITNIPF